MNFPRFALPILLLSALAAAAPPSRDRQLIPKAVYTSRSQEIASLSGRLGREIGASFRSFEHLGPKGKSMKCRLFEPKTSRGKKYPLVIFLHGSGSRGFDGLSHLTRGGALGAGIWTLPEVQRKNPCYVLAPQCPPEPDAWIKAEDWGDAGRPFRENPSTAMTMVLEVLDQLVGEYPIDESRIYVTGISMGGYGSWDIITRQPERFAAAVPICGALADAQAKRIFQIPVWMFHGSADPVVSASASQKAFEDLTAAGGRPRFTEYEAGDHGIAGFAYTEPGLVEWLFTQRRE